MKINLTAIVKAKPEFLDEVKTALENMVIETKKDFFFYKEIEPAAGTGVHCMHRLFRGWRDTCFG
ncbi:hypothetical protein [Algoriphagus sp. Y33]|uniref:hypothetical protein n=1 Tax=Algoriphagus sp. Y33 TaxID=2772483 RepID=UPI00177C749E|nr:hypothetical protein [Algoriphagus sp. Y33]